MQIKIPTPEAVSPAPDELTGEALKDLTAVSAAGRVFLLDLGIIKYGSDDKIHAAAFIFACILLFVTVAFYTAGFFAHDTAWAEEAVKWSGSTFLFVAGIVLGKASGGMKTES